MAWHTLRAMPAAGARILPLFHPYGDPPDDRAFDFVHIAAIASQASHDRIVAAHRHRHLFQILLIARGRGELTYETSSFAFAAPCAILVPATVAHGVRFAQSETEGFVLSFTEHDVDGF